jgi:hypothetical protein
MKCPQHSIQSTTPKAGAVPAPNVPVIMFPTAPSPSLHSKDTGVYLKQRPINGANEPHLIISNDNEESIANIFAFGAFADKNNGIVYHNLTGLFPFMYWMAVSASLYCIITNPIASCRHPLLA